MEAGYDVIGNKYSSFPSKLNQLIENYITGF